MLLNEFSVFFQQTKVTILKYLSLIVFTILLTSCSNSQVSTEDEDAYKEMLVGGPCEGCEAVFEYGDKVLNNVDTLPDFNEEGVQIKVEGTVYRNNGVTPAKDVIIYVYHTNQEGLYKAEKDAQGWGKQHGYIRTWLKTDENGHYEFYTLKPAPYPNRTDPAHIHYTILEPNGKYYWIGSCHFKGDNLLTEKEINPNNPRGGTSGLLNLKKEGSLLVGNRDIILGKNIPGHH